MDKEFAEAFKEEIELDEMPNRANMEKINSLLKKYSGKFKWRDEVLYVEKGIEKDVTSLIKKGGLTATVRVSSNPMREEVELDESLALQLKMAFSDAKIKMKSDKGKIVIAKRDKKKAMDVLSKTLPSKLKKYVDKAVDNFLVFEEVEIEEKKAATGYELYHKDFSSAMQHAYAHAKKKGVIVDPKEIDDKVATGPKKPSNGKTNRYILGTNSRKKVHIQVANLDNKRYELNMYIESAFDHLAKVKNILERIEPEEVELEEVPSSNQAAIDAFLKKGGKIKKHTPDLKKRKKDVDSFRKSFANTVQKQKDADKKTTRRYVSGGGKRDNSTSYNTSNYITHKDINKFPRSLASGLQKIISGAKMQKHEIKHTTYGKIPGMGITFPGSIAPKLMIQFDERIKDPNIGKIGADPEYDEKGTDPTTYRKFQMTVWINEAATAKDRKSDRVDWFQRKEFEGKSADEVAKRTLQYLKTKVKRMAKEEVEIDEGKFKKGDIVIPNMGPHKGEKHKIIHDFGDGSYNITPQKHSRFIKYKQGAAKAKENQLKLVKEEVEIQEHCGECEMGITEEVSTKEFDALKKGDTVTIEFKSPMSTGKSTFKVTAKNVVGKARIEKVTLKNVKRPNTVKFFLYKRGNKVSLAQGDMAASVVSFTKEGIDIEKASMGAVIKDFQNSDAPQFKGKSDKKRKEMAIAAKLSKEQKEEDDPKSKRKDKINLKPKMEDKQMKKLRELQAGLREKRAQEGTLKKTVSDYHKEEVVKEAVLDNGIEVGEQEFDLKYRPDALYPNLNVNFAKYIDEGLEGPYEVGSEVYFYDRKVQMFYSVSSEDYVDEETAKDIAYRLHKHGFYKPELGR